MRTEEEIKKEIAFLYTMINEVMDPRFAKQRIIALEWVLEEDEDSR